MRLDHYVKFGNDKIHMMSILLSIVVILCSGLIVYLITRRALFSDFKQLERGVLNRNERRQALAQEDTGLRSKKPKQVEAFDVVWKKLQGDVMRPPDYPAVFAVLMGMGY